jgi:hypothetical protein
VVVHFQCIAANFFNGLREDPLELIIVFFVFLSHQTQLLLITLLLDEFDYFLDGLTERLFGIGLRVLNEVNDVPVVLIEEGEVRRQVRVEAVSVNRPRE